VVLDLFDTVIYLYLDEATLRQRMAGRHAGQFAFAPHEQQAILGWRQSSEATYRSSGAVMIDAALPVEVVVSSVLKAAMETFKDLPV